ncbi:MAG: cob(I)yrinic acid a,c-diamide adenosyltransferase [Myxococcales bacterium]|jgi:cob(I)alamin adenosyltransferase
MKIYTKTGDRGETGLFGGARVSKAEPRVDAYGNVDELNSVIGAARAALAGAGERAAQLDGMLHAIQCDLLALGSELACVPGKDAKLGIDLVDEADIARLEREIDALEEGLAPLQNFILPGGSPGASMLHLARTVCRRAERSLVGLSAEESVRDGLVRYLNRLSDLLFVMARSANSAAGVEDVPWIPRSDG